MHQTCGFLALPHSKVQANMGDAVRLSHRNKWREREKDVLITKIGQMLEEMLVFNMI